MKKQLLGIDIGGTKCAIVYGVKENDKMEIVDKIKFPTTNVTETIDNIIKTTEQMMESHGVVPSDIYSIGISCGGPLDKDKGIVMSPPNLPGWDNIPIVSIINEHFGIPTSIQNDANACALAEWMYGAGRNSKNMVFLTFGTGLGAGLILDGKLYSGTNDNAGELGHIRLSEFGPVGYGKIGSLESFASGNGIAQLSKMFLMEKFQMGEKVDWCKPEDIDNINAHKVAEAAKNGDKLAKHIYDVSATYLGMGLSIVIDILNPEVIVIGGVYTRNSCMMEGPMMNMINKEALSCASKVCKVKPAELGENIGDYAALSVADNLTV